LYPETGDFVAVYGNKIASFRNPDTKLPSSETSVDRPLEDIILRFSSFLYQSVKGVEGSVSK